MEEQSVTAAYIPTSDVPLDFAVLLAPISDDSPTGLDLREDVSNSSIYYHLRECRTSARNQERSALANGDADFIKPSDWAAIIDTVPRILQTQSKDLEIVAWFIEALTRTHGFSGAAAGFHLAQQLIENFGSSLYPLPDDDGVASQLSALTGLNGFGSEGALISPLKSIPLTEGSPPAPFSAWQCEQAFETERITDESRRAARTKSGFISQTDIDQAIAETSPALLSQLAEDIDSAIAAFASYQTTIDAFCTDTPQPTSRIRDTLNSIKQTLQHIAGEKIRNYRLLQSSAVGNDAVATEGGTIAPVHQGQLDRAAALRQLRDIAAFFRRTEPHSPISYAVEQAVYWSELSLPELIGELIPDENARDKFRTLSGIRATER